MLDATARLEAVQFRAEIQKDPRSISLLTHDMQLTLEPLDDLVDTAESQGQLAVVPHRFLRVPRDVEERAFDVQWMSDEEWVAVDGEVR